MPGPESRKKSSQWDVLIVDSDTKTREEIRLVVRACGFSARVFTDGRPALEEVKLTPPRMLILELLLPVMDGFELCQAIRHDLKIIKLPIVCVSSISWGSVDLPRLLERRFQAQFLPKGSLATGLISLLDQKLNIGRAKHPSGEYRHVASKNRSVRSELVKHPKDLISPEMMDINIGIDEHVRTQQLTREFEEEVANISAVPSRRDVRVQAEYQVQFENMNELVDEFTHNISAGGLFIRSLNPPPLDEITRVQIHIPDHDRTIEVEARVVHIVTHDQVSADCQGPGFGVEFLNLAGHDRELILSTIRSLKSTKQYDQMTIDWVVIIGLPMLPMIGRPNFLLRRNIRIIEFPHVDAANEFLALNQAALVVIGERAFEKGDALPALKKLDTLVDKTTQRMVVLDRMRDLPEVLSQGLCHVVLDTSLTIGNILDEIGHRLRIIRRRSMRVPYQSSVTIRKQPAESDEFTAQMLNFSSGGMLISSNKRIRSGSTILLTFALPETETLQCRAVVVHSRKENDGFIYGVAFCEYIGDAEDRIHHCVQKQVNFREFFRWMKNRYFEWP